ncbi:MAG: hypothetical protein QOJ29_2561, partial [Thermoleophilaceae bacterium]|nr:hypothetical protein [Thermoleophilaceae bacterium]
AWLDKTWLPVKHQLLTQVGHHLQATEEGMVRDIRLGPLLRWHRRIRPRATEALGLRVGLGDTVGDNTTLLSAGQVMDGRDAGRLRDAFVVREPHQEPADRAWTRMLERLHKDAMEAARHGREQDWREIADAYERVLLRLPRAARVWGLPYEGAVMAPGFFGQGPVQRIRDFLYEELLVAVDNNHRELIGPITYFPQQIAVAAARLGAPAIAGPMFSLYPAMYRLAAGS